MDLKLLVTILLFLAVLGFIYLFYYGSPLATLNYEQGELSNSSQFSEFLQSSENVFLVMDLRGTTPLQRSNIMQCGTDFAGSEGIAGKNISVYALEGSECFMSEGKKDINSCIKDAQSSTSIFVKAGSGSVFYKNSMVLGITEDYKLKECNIKSVKQNSNSS